MVQFTNILDNMVMMPMAPNLRNFFHLNSQEFGFLVSSYGIAAFISALIASTFVDRFDRKKSLLFLYGGFIIGTTLCGFADSYPILLAFRILTGAFGGVVGSVILSIIGDSLPLEKRGRGMGILMSGFSLAAVIGVPLSIYFSETYSWNVPFYGIACLSLLIYIGAFSFVPNVTSHLQSAGKNNQVGLYRMILKDSNLTFSIFFSISLIFAHFSIIPYISDFLVHNLGFNMKKELIFMYILGGLLSSIAAPFFGKMADKYGRYKIYSILSLLAFIPLFALPHLNSHNFALMLLVSASFFIFSGGRMVPGQAMITSAVPARVRGGFMSLNSAFQALSMGLCAIIGGVIITNDAENKLNHYEYLGYMGMIFTLLGILLGSRIKPYQEVKPKATVQEEASIQI